MNFKRITCFSDIHLSAKCLVICDIDETILKFFDINKEWWKKSFDKYYATSGDYDSACAESLKEWENYIDTYDPVLSNEDFPIFLGKLKTLEAEVIFITARNGSLLSVTERHFHHLGLSFNEHKIFHIGEIPKGEYLRDNLKLLINSTSLVIFIDDYMYNLESVYEEFKNRIEYYYFEM
jgi:hypothetical protein